MTDRITDYDALAGRIMTGIRHERAKLAALRRLILASASWAVSVAFLVPLARFLSSESAASGFSALLRMVFTDLGAVAANWQDFAMGVLESFPALALAALMGMLFLIVWLVRQIIADGAVVWPEKLNYRNR